MKLPAITAALIFAVITPLAAFADPVGRYSVVGTDPGDGGEYTGEVSVQRTGETYSVIWVVNGVEYLGTALGAGDFGDEFVIGPADPRDTVLAVSYISDNSFGLAYYVQQSDGSWRGIWTYGGSERIGTEIWYP